MHSDIHQLAGIGIGPFNLSLAALSAHVPDLRARFFDRQSAFAWHPGMMLDGTRMQTSFLKDLVTPVDPTSRYSFLAFLVAHGRFYRFLNADFARARRTEFARYMKWVAEQLDNVEFGREVVDVRFEHGRFELSFAGRPPFAAHNLAVGVGLEKHVPDWARRHVSPRCIHSDAYLDAALACQRRKVVVIGGGQSGLEIFLDLLAGAKGGAREVTLVTRRKNLDPLDETAFTNEYFTPEYVRRFHVLPRARRAELARQQKMTGDGASPDTLRELSQRLYEHDFLEVAGRPYQILPDREVVRMSEHGDGFELEMHNGFESTREVIRADVVVLATGYRYGVPRCLERLSPLLEREPSGELVLEQDYRARWSGPSGNRIYMLNAGRLSHGVPDAQLSLAAWRAAIIVNGLAGSAVYPVDAGDGPLRWHAPEGCVWSTALRAGQASSLTSAAAPTNT